ncbi:oligopeptide ABC transporter permease OppB [Phenylobacterium sp.]|uniref:oligopeptide ABC transporter permease OppB n=1 Tax=Phenylobacterium sp. TaxID=1871053 RepID=UPI0008D72783|nr:oligopeptide ABC transporter permease OppB [Phenylobacterium sp.]MBA4792238.1 oligopeptide ABC transporter permease OppB [Phenylobacterium sp.]MBC7167805.1 oligopeptide ABC transporter permease OppB [Phenylobacterium sp.]OHB33213.1 MAG: oligopeptide transporter permease [Phenylobacterium sp. RIFCSPHIGHO2_01_FULL_70_10]
MLRFIGRRLLIAIPTLFLVVTVAFFMMRAAPGSPFDSDRKLSPEIEANVMAKYGMDRPLHEQYVNYIGGVLQGDLGPSLKYKDKSVLQILQENYRVSLTLGLSAIVLASIIGVSLGVLAALRQNQTTDYVVMTVAILGVCIPTFVTAPVLVLVIASKLGWLPSAGWNGGALPNLVLPIVVLTLPQVAIISRLTRAGMIEVLRSNYIRTARAKGLPENRIVRRHALQAAILPLVSYLGPAAAGLITGSLVVEKIFNLPGLGKFFVISALQRDYTVVMGMVIFYAGLILLLNLIADLLHAVLDPRVRLA